MDLHDDAITENETEKNKVKILPFHGVAPQRYFSLFMARADDRKHSDTGKMKKYNRIDSHPVQEKSIEAFPTLEAIGVESLVEIESARGSGDEEI